jgi:crotonobetainyl-CoA:carnitine CoA-transferase CaiB-like acyl-CoA transferase
MSRTPGVPAGPGPALGEHTDEVLAALGYAEEEVAAMKRSGAVAGPAHRAEGRFLS